MAKHKPPTKSELAEWKKYGSYAGHDAVQRMIVEINNLRTRLNDNATRLMVAYRESRSALEALKGRGDCFCRSGDNPILAGRCNPQCKQAMAVLRS